MDILEALSKQHVVSVNNSSGIHDAVFETALFRLGVDKDVIADCLLEPVELREGLLNYFENRK